MGLTVGKRPFLVSGYNDGPDQLAYDPNVSQTRPPSSKQ